VGLVCLFHGAGAEDETERDRRHQAIRGEIERLRDEMDGLAQREQTLLGEVERLGAEIRLREAELAEASLLLEEVTSAIEEQDRKIATLFEAQQERRAYLRFRVQELYKRGPVSDLRRLVGGQELASYLPGIRYAAYLSERDGRVLREFRSDAERLQVERRKLAAERDRLLEARARSERARIALTGSRERHRRAVERIQGDRRQRQVALQELEGASRELTRLVSELGKGGAEPSLDIRKFRGLLDLPARGDVSAGFGNLVHPRFKTVVPHPGIDIEAAAGEGFRSVFDGHVLFAAWLHGYGLTAIVDHGGGVASVYAHADVLLVARGESVLRGQQLGKVGETGSLRGPYLYFEIREGGKPVDPAGWLRSSGGD
jgi:septal ring factor EnvC (AmiA/AmiB activator)